MSAYYRGEGARSYDQRHQHFTERTLSKTIAALDVKALTSHAECLQRVPRLLDVACVTGILLSLLHKRIPSAELSGIDGSPEMLVWRKNASLEFPIFGSNRSWWVLTLRPISHFQPRVLSLFTCTNALHAMPDPIATLTALHRLLVPGGQLLLEDFMWRLPSFSWGILTRLARRVGTGPLHPYTLVQARPLCEQAGLSIAHAHAFVIDWLLSGWVIFNVKQ